MTTVLTDFEAPAQRPAKIDERHLARLAVVYIRQSSMHQVQHNQESTRLQYSLGGRARQWGWEPDRVLVLDEDLGVSGASAAGRHDFQRLLAEVALDHVGLILGAEMSRLARSNKDWHDLLELCARFGTLIADLDGLYDPTHFNDRLLLGLKGTMSEAELHVLRQRLVQGKLQKARRGELGKPVPTGYLRQPGGEVVLDPDEEVRAVVRFIFDQFERSGSVYRVLRELAAQGFQIGVRRRTGEDRGGLEWHRPHRGMIANMIRNPIYAGAYVYGRRSVDRRRQVPGRPATGRTPLVAPGAWQACVRDRLPAYISWEQYERNQGRLAAARARVAPSSVRNGTALLSGLVVCGRCNRRMSVQYFTRRGRSTGRYVCGQAAGHFGERVCSGLSASCLDRAVAQLALAALEPAALEISLRVSEDLEQQRDQLEALWRKRLERAHYEVERAGRQYQKVEPENRLVARTLEQAWEAALRAERDLREEHERRDHQTPRHLTAEERSQIRALADNLPELWQAATTTAADRKAVLRLLIDHVTVTVNPNAVWAESEVHWIGGQVTRHRVRRPVAKLTQMEDHGALMTRIHELRRAGETAPRIATRLNKEGWTTPTQRNGFNDRLVRAMMERHGSVPRGATPPPRDMPHGWWLPELASELGMSSITLYGWLRRGWAKGSKVDGRWVVIADGKERRRLRKLRLDHPTPPRHEE
ncbi:MAG: recombinase family protein [Deltaproteobacteria bacterium]|nr:recombinase family protein [Deltaproteobacteria bacterium]